MKADADAGKAMDAVRGLRDDITADRIILWRDPSKPGNALAQLDERISAWLKAKEKTNA